MAAQWAVEPTKKRYVYFYRGHPRGQDPGGRGRRELRVYRRVNQTVQEGREAREERTEILILGEALCGIDPSWDHPVFLEGLEEED